MTLPFGGGISYNYGIALPPGKEVSIEIFAVGIKSGDYSGDVDFCINSSTKFLTQVVRTVVQ